MPNSASVLMMRSACSSVLSTPAFDWWSYRGGVFEKADEQGPVLTFTADAATVGREYQAVATLAEGFTVSASIGIPAFAEVDAPEIPEITRDVTVTCYKKDFMSIGDVFTLEASITGFEGVEYRVQWQYDAGKGWQDFPGGNALTLRVVADRANMGYTWRVLVTVIEEAE